MSRTSELSDKAVVFDAPSLGDTSIDDEYTLSAFGDISLSEAYFLPSLASDVSPKGPVKPKNLKRAPPPLMRNLTNESQDKVSFFAVIRRHLDL